MALPLAAIGEAVLAQGRTGGKSAGQSKGLLGHASFGSALQQKLDQLGADGNDLLAQLAGLLQGGTPLAAIIDRVAKQVSDMLARASGNASNTPRRRTLERALAAALAPPGTSPPNQSAAGKAAALEHRLANLLSAVTGELKNAGQQSRFSGPVLDANSAKEIPAQQQSKDPTGMQPQSPAGSLAFAESILRSVVQQLHNAAPQTPQTPQTPQAAQTPAPAITVASADVLGRMLARAAKADPSADPPVSASSSQPGAPVSPSDLFARLMTVIAQTANENTSHQDSGHSSQSAFSQNALAQTHHASSPANTAPVPAFASAVNAASAPAVQPAASAPTPYAMDPQSVIEQVVKGIVLRNSGATSEVRMRLQPDHLGDVSLKLTWTGNTISANIIAQNANVRDLLMQNQQQLARTLSEAGLSLGQFSVDVSGGNPGFSQRQTAQHRSLSRAGTLHFDTLPEDDTWADARFGPPVMAGTRSLVLNYLA